MKQLNLCKLAAEALSERFDWCFSKMVHDHFADIEEAVPGQSCQYENDLLACKPLLDDWLLTIQDKHEKARLLNEMEAACEDLGLECETLIQVFDPMLWMDIKAGKRTWMDGIMRLLALMDMQPSPDESEGSPAAMMAH